VPQRAAAVGSCRPALACGVVPAGEPPPVAEVFPVTPATILRWHRNLVAASGLREPTAARAERAAGTSVKALIIRMAEENPAYVELGIMWSLAAGQVISRSVCASASHKFCAPRRFTSSTSHGGGPMHEAFWMGCSTGGGCAGGGPARPEAIGWS